MTLIHSKLHADLSCHLLIPSQGYGASVVKTKNYSRVEGKDLMIHYLYIEVDNGFWAPTRTIKLGSFDARVVQQIKTAVDAFRPTADPQD